MASAEVACLSGLTAETSKRGICLRPAPCALSLRVMSSKVQDPRGLDVGRLVVSSFLTLELRPCGSSIPTALGLFPSPLRPLELKRLLWSETTVGLAGRASALIADPAEALTSSRVWGGMLVVVPVCLPPSSLR
eukprot:765791-Hanusia_phi.AAC.4